MNQLQSFDVLPELLAKAQQARQRLLLYCDCDLNQVEETLARLMPYFNETLIIDNQFQQPVKQIKPLLGTEYDLVVLNVYAFFDANLLAMVSPMVRAGGAFVMITPKLSAWPKMAQNQKTLYPTPHFIAFVIKQIHEMESFWFRLYSNGIDIKKRTFNKNIVDYTEQNNAITAIKRVYEGRGKRPLVIEADRGRGKSSALGIAATELIDRYPTIRIGITAQSKQSIQTLMAHLTPSSNDKINWQYFSVDEVIANRPSVDLLLIDEAATFPVYALTQMLKHYNRIVFSTTINGYEGSGNGFSLRFKKVLEQNSPHWRHIKLFTPIRFAENDALERFTQKSTQLDAQLLDWQATEEQFVLSWVNQSDLIADDHLLNSVMGLLRLAHYQTTPNDFSLILDNPKILIAVLTQGKNLVAVALLIKEGQLSNDQKQQITTTPRRFRGQLLPQLLFTQGYQNALNGQYWRIMRIAVRPDKQQQYYGSELVSFLKQSALKRQIDWLGTNFTLEPDVFSFWRKNQLYPVQMGSKRNKSTGMNAITCLYAVSENAETIMQQYRSYFAKVLPIQLLGESLGISSKVAQQLFDGLDFKLTSYDYHAVKLFSSAQSSYETSQLALQRFLCHYLSKSFECNSVVPDFIIDKIILNKPFDAIVKQYDLTGRKTTDKLMRSFFTSCLNKSEG